MPGAQHPPAHKHVSIHVVSHVRNSLWKPSSLTSILKPGGLSQRWKQADEWCAQIICGMSSLSMLSVSHTCTRDELGSMRSPPWNGQWHWLGHSTWPHWHGDRWGIWFSTPWWRRHRVKSWGWRVLCVQAPHLGAEALIWPVSFKFYLCYDMHFHSPHRCIDFRIHHNRTECHTQAWQPQLSIPTAVYLQWQAAPQQGAWQQPPDVASWPLLVIDIFGKPTANDCWCGLTCLHCLSQTHKYTISSLPNPTDGRMKHLFTLDVSAWHLSHLEQHFL